MCVQEISVLTVTHRLNFGKGSLAWMLEVFTLGGAMLFLSHLLKSGVMKKAWLANKVLEKN